MSRPGQFCAAACHMANNYLVCRANLIQDLELILRDQQLLWRWRLCCFLFDGGFIKVSVIVGCAEGGIVIFCDCVTDPPSIPS